MIVNTTVDSSLCANPYNNTCTRQINADKGFNYGVEVAFNQSLFNDILSFGANYTFTDSKQTRMASSTNFGSSSRILNYPTHLLNANIIYKPINSLDLILYTTYQGKRWSYNNQTSAYYTQPAVFLMDVKVNFRPIESLQLSIGAYNVLDKDYYDANYMIPGRRIYASVEYKY